MRLNVRASLATIAILFSSSLSVPREDRDILRGNGNAEWILMVIISSFRPHDPQSLSSSCTIARENLPRPLLRSHGAIKQARLTRHNTIVNSLLILMTRALTFLFLIRLEWRCVYPSVERAGTRRAIPTPPSLPPSSLSGLEGDTLTSLALSLSFLLLNYFLSYKMGHDKMKYVHY